MRKFGFLLSGELISLRKQKAAIATSGEGTAASSQLEPESTTAAITVELACKPSYLALSQLQVSFS